MHQIIPYVMHHYCAHALLSDFDLDVNPNLVLARLGIKNVGDLTLIEGPLWVENNVYGRQLAGSENFRFIM